jgi:electron transfer flavoprotein beta subunit
MIAVCVKWTEHGLSAADEAAVEMALRHGDVIAESVTVVSVGGPLADRGLRTAVACGAAHAIRVNAPDTLDSVHVADALVPVVTHSSAVWCGDYSADRGSGSVPAFLAARLGRQQALGLVGVEFADPLRVVRRLDGGRREILRITAPAVLSVEGSIARLRRAPLRAAIAAQSTEVLPLAVAVRPGDNAPVARRLYRPRARSLPAPSGSTALARLLILTDTSAARRQGETVEATPVDAARHVVAALRDWGYLDTESAVRSRHSAPPAHH